MGNGRPHDNPIPDIINHGILTYSETADELIRQIAQLTTPKEFVELVNWKHPLKIREFES